MPDAPPSNSPKVVTVSLNPAVDQTARVPNFTAGAVNRVGWEQSDAGGKGVNVASFLAHAGIPVAVTGLLGEAYLTPFVRLFADKGILDRFVRVPGSTRVNVKIVDEVQDRVTDINFPGLHGEPRHLAAVDDALDDLAGTAETFVLSGSVPAGVADSVYATMVDRLKRLGKRVVLDASGLAFAAAIASRPNIIKPNLEELQELIGRRPESDGEIVAAARELLAKDIGLVAVSMGPRGAMFVEEGAAVLAVPPKITVKSTVGAGDAMVAGIVAGALKGFGLADRARLATAFSVGALGEIGPRLPPLKVIEATMRDVAIQTIDNKNSGS